MAPRTRNASKQSSNQPSTPVPAPRSAQALMLPDGAAPLGRVPLPLKHSNTYGSPMPDLPSPFVMRTGNVRSMLQIVATQDKDADKKRKAAAAEAAAQKAADDAAAKQGQQTPAARKGRSQAPPAAKAPTPAPAPAPPPAPAPAPKTAPKKVVPTKAVAKKTVPKKTTLQKAAPEKVVPKKPAPKKAGPLPKTPIRPLPSLTKKAPGQDPDDSPDDDPDDNPSDDSSDNSDEDSSGDSDGDSDGDPNGDPDDDSDYAADDNMDVDPNNGPDDDSDEAPDDDMDDAAPRTPPRRLPKRARDAQDSPTPSSSDQDASDGQDSPAPSPPDQNVQTPPQLPSLPSSPPAQSSSPPQVPSPPHDTSPVQAPPQTPTPGPPTAPTVAQPDQDLAVLQQVFRPLSPAPALEAARERSKRCADDMDPESVSKKEELERHRARSAELLRQLRKSREAPTAAGNNSNADGAPQNPASDGPTSAPDPTLSQIFSTVSAPSRPRAPSIDNLRVSLINSNKRVVALQNQLPMSTRSFREEVGVYSGADGPPSSPLAQHFASVIHQNRPLGSVAAPSVPAGANQPNAPAHARAPAQRAPPQRPPPNIPVAPQGLPPQVGASTSNVQPVVGQRPAPSAQTRTRDTLRPPRDPRSAPSASQGDRQPWYRRFSFKAAWSSVTWPQKLLKWLLRGLLFAFAFTIFTWLLRDPVQQGRLRFYGWNGWDDWQYNLGQFIPSGHFIPSGIRNPLSSLRNATGADGLSADLWSQMMRLKGLEKDMSDTDKTIKKLEKMLPDYIAVKKDPKTGKTTIDEHLWQAVKERIQEDDDISSVEQAAKEITDNQWKVLEGRVEKTTEKTTKKLLDSKELQNKVESTLRKNLPSYFEHWTRNNEKQVKAIISRVMPKGSKVGSGEVPAINEDEILSKAEDLIKEKLDGIDLTDKVVSREEFLSTLRESLAKQQKELERYFASSREELAPMLKKAQAIIDAGKDMPSQKEVRKMIEEFVKRTVSNAPVHAVARGQIAAHFEQVVRHQTNYFAFGNGAMVDSALSSPAWDPKTDAKEGSEAWRLFMQKLPRYQLERGVALTDWSDPGHCFCAGTSDRPAEIVVQMREPIVPQQLVVEHIGPDATTDPGSMPKDLEVWAAVEVDMRSRAMNFMLDHFPNSQAFDPLGDRGYHKIGEFTYHHSRADNGMAIFQFSPELEDAPLATDKIVVRARTNYGSPDHTCFYRLRMYGKLYERTMQ